MDNKRKPISNYELERMYCDMLNECYEPVKIAGYEYETARALAEIDPVAFRCGLSDYIDGLIGETIEEIDGEYYLINDTRS